MKILSIDTPALADIQDLYKGAKFYCSADTPASELHDFDAVVSFHTLQHLTQPEVLPTLNKWKTYLKPKGHILTLVPSLEWTAKSIIRGDVNPLIIPSIFGMNGENHTGFTLLVLRRFFELAELQVVSARSGEYTIDTSRGTFQAEQHLVKGVLP